MAFSRLQVRRISIAALGLLGGCHGPRNSLDPASAEAGRIGSLWWIFFAVCAAVFAAVVVTLIGAIARGQRTPRETSPSVPAPTVHTPEEPSERRLRAVVGTAVGLTVVTLLGLLLTDFSIGRSLRPPTDLGDLTIRITGHQWWWQIEYDDPKPSNHIITANEFHLPVGKRARILLQSADVIHSFWLPNLQGKKDLIPGHPGTLWLQPTRTGTYHGQCAEFCGYQHAHMGLTAVVESPEEFAKWQEHQRKSADEPSDERAKRGKEVFHTRTCVLCHAIQGTIAGSHLGPPLTHLASQGTIGAGALPNTRGTLARWIVDPQALKPGVRMPPNALSADELEALLDYLETLK
jgi:cytochrome c oxidase subunit 2